MATEATINLYQNADQVVIVDVNNPATSPPGEPFDCTGLEVDFYLKPHIGLSDSDPSVIKLSTLGGQITLSTPSFSTVNSRATVTIARANVPNAYTGFWRCDVVGATKVPCGYGELNIIQQ